MFAAINTHRYCYYDNHYIGSAEIFLLKPQKHNMEEQTACEWWHEISDFARRQLARVVLNKVPDSLSREDILRVHKEIKTTKPQNLCKS
jgi:hypothetical protein